MMLKTPNNNTIGDVEQLLPMKNQQKDKKDQTDG